MGHIENQQGRGRRRNPGSRPAPTPPANSKPAPPRNMRRPHAHSMLACLLNFERPCYRKHRLIKATHSDHLMLSGHLKSCQLSCATTHAAPLPTRCSSRSPRKANVLSHAGSQDTCMRGHGGCPLAASKASTCTPLISASKFQNPAHRLSGVHSRRTRPFRAFFRPGRKNGHHPLGMMPVFRVVREKSSYETAPGTRRRKSASRSASPSPC